MANMLYGTPQSDLPPNLIRTVFTDEMLQWIHYHALRVDIEDNNDKAAMLKYFIPKDFIELGTGTNRIAYLHNGMVYKIALDRRG